MFAPRSVVFLLSLFLTFGGGHSRAADNDEPSEETKAIIKTALGYMKSKKSEERVRGVEMLGELESKGKTARRDLCQAMLDATSPKVQTAAADALRKVDKEMADAAEKIFINMSLKTVAEVGLQKEKAEPLAPLVLALASKIATGTVAEKVDASGLETCFTTLAAIAPNDDAVNAMLISGITFDNANYAAGYRAAFKIYSYESVRATAVSLVGGIKHAKQAVKPLILAAQKYPESVRVTAIQTLADIHEASNEKLIDKALADMRFDPSESVRKAVDAATTTIKAKGAKK